MLQIADMLGASKILKKPFDLSILEKIISEIAEPTKAKE